MADLAEVLPDFDDKPWRYLLFSLEKKEVTVAELITLDPLEIARRCPLPPREVAKLAKVLIQALHAELGFVSMGPPKPRNGKGKVKLPFRNGVDMVQRQFISTMDESIDACLGGGILTGYMTEIVGESAAGKTQFALSLLLSAQVAQPSGPPHSVIYVSTEGSLNTRRLTQILNTHPRYQSMNAHERPSLDRVITIETNDLEYQDQIIQYRLPHAVKMYQPKLLVMDSVAANYRAEYSSNSSKALANRAVELVRLGTMLRDVARIHDLAVVVTNQVSDRFEDGRTLSDKIRLSSSAPPTAQSSQPTVPIAASQAQRDEIMSLDFQQRFFTGWGETSALPGPYETLKTPALGLTWANQISARIVLKLEMDHLTHQINPHASGNLWSDRKRRRFVSVVFAPWVEPSVKEVEYEVTAHGVASVPERAAHGKPPQVDGLSSEDAELLDPKYWGDLEEDADEEFP